MIIFECHVSNVEMCSDAFKHEPLEIEGVDSGNVFTVMSKTIVEGDDDVDVGCGNAFGGDGDDLDDTAVKVNNLVSNFGFSPSSALADKKAFKQLFAQYVKKVQSALKPKKNGGEEALKAFQNEAKAVFKWLLKNHKDLELYMNSSGECDGHFGIGWWGPDCEQTPRFIYWKTALRQTKV